MPKLTEKALSERRTRIGVAAITCIVRKGFGATSMADIIKESELSSGAIYCHFESKDEIIDFATSQSLKHLMLKLDEETMKLKISSPAEVFADLINHSITPEIAQVIRVIWQETAHNDQMRALAKRNAESLKSFLLRALEPWAHQQSRDVHGLVDLLMLLFQGYIIREGINPKTDKKGIIDLISKQLAV
jgi:AcrR family transcriptional regulator